MYIRARLAEQWIFSQEGGNPLSRNSKSAGFSQPEKEYYGGGNPADLQEMLAKSPPFPFAFGSELVHFFQAGKSPDFLESCPAERALNV